MFDTDGRLDGINVALLDLSNELKAQARSRRLNRGKLWSLTERCKAEPSANSVRGLLLNLANPSVLAAMLPTMGDTLMGLAHDCAGDAL